MIPDVQTHVEIDEHGTVVVSHSENSKLLLVAI